MKLNAFRFLRFIAIALVGLSAVFYVGVSASNFPERYPNLTLAIGDRVAGFLGRLTLPIKLAQLSLQEVDSQILIPVLGSRVEGVADTFGSPRDGERSHEGQDIFAPKGTPIFSATNGYVTRIGQGNLGGNYVNITGAGGRRYYYAHLDRFPQGLQVGQRVTTDTVIGFVGNTGNAQTTPDHLHLGVYESRQAINPLPLLVNR